MEGRSIDYNNVIRWYGSTDDLATDIAYLLDIKSLLKLIERLNMIADPSNELYGKLKGKGWK